MLSHSLPLKGYAFFILLCLCVPSGPVAVGGPWLGQRVGGGAEGEEKAERRDKESFVLFGLCSTKRWLTIPQHIMCG